MNDQFPAAVPGRVRPAEVRVSGQGRSAPQQQVTGGPVAAVLQMEPDLLGQWPDGIGGGRRICEARSVARLGGAEPFVASDGDLIGLRLGQGSAPSHGAGHQVGRQPFGELLVASGWLVASG